MKGPTIALGVLAVIGLTVGSALQWFSNLRAFDFLRTNFPDAWTYWQPIAALAFLSLGFLTAVAVAVEVWKQRSPKSIGPALAPASATRRTTATTSGQQSPIAARDVIQHIYGQQSAPPQPQLRRREEYCRTVEPYTKVMWITAEDIDGNFTRFRETTRDSPLGLLALVCFIQSNAFLTLDMLYQGNGEAVRARGCVVDQQFGYVNAIPGTTYSVIISVFHDDRHTILDDKRSSSDPGSEALPRDIDGLGDDVKVTINPFLGDDPGPPITLRMGVVNGAFRVLQQPNANAREPENVRYSVQEGHSRNTMIRVRELEFLPKMWLMFNEMHGFANIAVGNSLIRSVAFDRMTDAVAREELTKIGFKSAQVDELLTKPTEDDKNTFYVDVFRWNAHDEAQSKQRELMNYIIENRIFLTSDLDTKMTELCKDIGVALSLYSAGKNANDWSRQHEHMTTIIKAFERLPEISRLMQDRLGTLPR